MHITRAHGRWKMEDAEDMNIKTMNETTIWRVVRVGVVRIQGSHAHP